MIPDQDIYLILAPLWAFVTVIFAVWTTKFGPETRRYYYPLVAMTGIMTVSFGLMSQGALVIVMEDGNEMPVGRLVMYAIVFPLMAGYVGLVGGLGRRRTGVVATGMVLLVLGVTIGWAPEPYASVGELLTLASLLVVAYLLLRPYDRIADARSGELRLLFGKLRNLLLMAWVLYSLVGLASHGALGLLTPFPGNFLASYIDFLVILAMSTILFRANDAMAQLVGDGTAWVVE